MRLHKKRVHLPQDWFGTHQHGRRFIVMGHQHGRRDVMWKHSIGTRQVYTYRTSSIKPPLGGGGLFISSPFEGVGGGGLNGDGRLIWKEGAAYLI